MGDSFCTVFRLSMIERCIEIFAVLQENRMKFYMFRPMYSKQVFGILTLFGFISVFLLAALLKLEITVSFLWLSLPIHSGQLTRI